MRCLQGDRITVGPEIRIGALHPRPCIYGTELGVDSDSGLGNTKWFGYWSLIFHRSDRSRASGTSVSDAPTTSCANRASGEDGYGFDYEKLLYWTSVYCRYCRVALGYILGWGSFCSVGRFDEGWVRHKKMRNIWIPLSRMLRFTVTSKLLRMHEQATKKLW